jgi:hypothetical protein
MPGPLTIAISGSSTSTRYMTMIGKSDNDGTSAMRGDNIQAAFHRSAPGILSAWPMGNGHDHEIEWLNCSMDSRIQ